MKAIMVIIMTITLSIFIINAKSIIIIMLQTILLRDMKKNISNNNNKTMYELSIFFQRFNNIFLQVNHNFYLLTPVLN